MRCGADVDRTRAPALHVDFDPVRTGRYRGTRFPQLRDHRVEMRRLRAEDPDASAGNRPGNEEGAGLDAVRQHTVFAGAKPLAAFDDDRVGAGTGDLRAHRGQERRKVDDLGFARGVLDDRAAARERRRHHQVLRAGDAHGVLDDARAAEPSRLGMDVAALDRDLGAHRLEARDVQVDRARADRATARQGNPRLAVARDERAEHEDRRAHRLDEVVGRDGIGEPARVDLDLAVRRPRSRQRPFDRAGESSWSRRGASGRSGS